MNAKAVNKKDDANRISFKGWVSLFVLILSFSGIFQNIEGPLKALDLGNLIGEFGSISDGLNFLGKGGSGAREGFLFALTLIPTTALAVGLIDVVEAMGAMKAAQKLFDPLLRPLLGIPGMAGVSFVASFTGSDVAAVLTKELVDEGHLTDDERTIFVSYQYAASAVIINTISTQAPLLPIVLLALGPILVIEIFCKILGANMVRLIIKIKNKKQESKKHE